MTIRLQFYSDITMSDITSSKIPIHLKEALKYIHPDSLIGALVILAAFILLGLFASRMLSKIIRSIEKRDTENRIDRLTANYLFQFSRFILWIFIFMLYAHVIPSLDKMGTALLASVSVASIVIGMAAQSTLGNLIAGISMIFYKPFRLGDRIQINAPTGQETGTVEAVSLGYTVLRTYDNRRVVIGNLIMSNQIMINMTSIDPRIMMTLPFSIGYGSDIDKARALAADLATHHPLVDECVGCPVTGLGSSSIDFTLRAWCADSSLARQAKNDLFESIKKSFDQEGIEIPYAYQNVIISSES